MMQSQVVPSPQGTATVPVPRPLLNSSTASTTSVVAVSQSTTSKVMHRSNRPGSTPMSSTLTATSFSSRTVTVCVSVAMLPLASVTVQVTIDSPRGNRPMSGALLDTEKEQLSSAIAMPRSETTAVQPPASA